MPLSWNEIRTRAIAFSQEWNDASNERTDAQIFWNELFKVFGVPQRRLSTFEYHVHKAGDKAGYIDLFWPGVLIAEHKSRGRNLDRAFQQAIDYFPGIRDAELPRYVVVSDFARIRIHDLETGDQTEIALEDFHEYIQLFGFIAGYEQRKFKEQDPVNVKAANKLARLHDGLRDFGYTGHELEVYLVRILFCLFAEDTGIFLPRGAFQDLIENRSGEDGTNLGALLNELFDVLNTPDEKRLRSRDEQLLALPYINGELFAERLRTASFDSRMRKLILECCDLDWGQISPAIFGSLFQGIMDRDLRRVLGAHYTSEQNILRVINPLFLEDLKAEFKRIKNQRRKLEEFHEKLGILQFFDPACGCGNFLVIAYRELRLLELEVIRKLYAQDQQQLTLDAISHYVKVDVDQFNGIEIDEWPCQIARTAMWLIDHQMNVMVSQEFGNAFVRIPLVASANIVNDNALRIDWNDVVPASDVDYIMGNPPFGGSKHLNDEKRMEMADVFKGVKGYGILDYVSAWYMVTVKYLGDEHGVISSENDALSIESARSKVKVGFVSTNSITQGEQVSVLWEELLLRGVKIHFAHRTFQWHSEAAGRAAVHCVIIGFAFFDTNSKWIFDYADIKGEPVSTKVGNINPYLVDAPDILVSNRTKPICNVPHLKIGNKPIDGGYYLFTEEEKVKFLEKEPLAEQYFRPWVGANEFLYNYHRWCLWLGDCPPSELRKMPLVMERIKSVQSYRRNSKSKPTQRIAEIPTRFHVENIPKDRFLVIPEVTSERRPYIPIGYLEPPVLASNLLKVVQDASLYHFGVLSSVMHMSWMRYVAGRLESRYRYSGGIVYNNFPWPVSPSDAQIARVEDAAQGVLEAREQFPNDSLADLYDAVAMPPALRKAHQKLDAAVDKAYGRRKFTNEPERVAFLFERYSEITG